MRCDETKTKTESGKRVGRKENEVDCCNYWSCDIG